MTDAFFWLFVWMPELSVSFKKSAERKKEEVKPPNPVYFPDFNPRLDGPISMFEEGV